MSRLSKKIDKNDMLDWYQWNPGLDNDHQTLGQVLQTLPASDPQEVPYIIKFFENPSSLFAFPGAISLARHDAIHVLLGRGLKNQDEAFVIGFTMGASKKIKNWQYKTFRWVASNLYPSWWRWNEEDLIAFDLGFGKGETSGAENLEYFPFERFLDMPLKELRQRLGINRQGLYATYRKERILIPGSKESNRLDHEWMDSDPSSITKPDGPDSKWNKKKVNK